MAQAVVIELTEDVAVVEQLVILGKVEIQGKNKKYN